MSTSVSIIDKFECPKGFSKENIAAQLYHEDIDDDSELWLLRMPCDFDPSLLENKSVVLDGSLNIIASNSHSDKVYECFSENYEMPNLCLVLPHKSSRELSPVKNIFKGSLSVAERMFSNDDTIIISEDLESGIAQNALNNVDESSFAKHTRRSIKRSNSNTGLHDDSFEIFDQTSADSYVKEPSISREKIKHKHSKKNRDKKSLDFNSVKKEPEFKFDDFPVCESQKM